MSTPQMTTAEALRSALASTIACSAQELQEAVGQVVVATAAELPASAAAGAYARSVFDPQARTTVLLVDRIPAGQEAQALVAEIERHHGRQAARAVLGDRADDLLAPAKARIEFKVIENDPGRSLGAVFVPKGEPLSGGLFGDAQTDMVEFSDLRYGVARAVKYLVAAPIAGISKGQRHSVFFGAHISVDDSQKLAAWVAELQGNGLAKTVDQAALAQGEVTVHDFVGTAPVEVYDRTQTDDSIKDGDVLNLGNGNVAILMKAWPTVVLGEIEHFHRLATGVTFDSVDDGKYAASAAKARELSGYIEQLPSVGGGHAAYEVTPEDVENVLRSNSLAVANTNGKSFESMAEELHGDLDFGLIEQAALAGDDLDEQTDYANDEIARQLREKGVLEPLKQADDSPSPGM